MAKPEVVLCGDLGAETQKCWAMIQKLNHPPHLFAFGSGGLWIDPDGSRAELTAAALGRYATDRIRFIRETKEGEMKTTTPPERLFHNMLAGPSMPLPELRGFTEVPVFSADGKLHYSPGYSHHSKLYYSPPQGFELEGPDPSQLDFAKEILLDELLGDFPFNGEASKGHAVAAILLPFVRPMIAGPTPLHLISKPKAGTGATLLSYIMAYPGLGRPVITSLPQQEDERRRTFFSLFRNHTDAVVLDNVTDLSGPTLASVLTETTLTDRIVGESTVASVPNRALWMATGNNPELSDEIARRVVPIHLDAREEHPHLRRGFRYPDLKALVARNRPLIIWAALTLAQNWLAEGRPSDPKQILGGFESWTAVIGGILHSANIPGFLGNLEQLRTRTDLESLAMMAFVTAWADTFGDADVKVSDLLPLAHNLEIRGRDPHSRSIQLGKKLSARRDQVLGPWVIRRGGISSGYQMWRLEAAK